MSTETVEGLPRAFLCPILYGRIVKKKPQNQKILGLCEQPW